MTSDGITIREPKSEVAHHQGKTGAAYEHSLHDVWSVMHKLQK